MNSTFTHDNFESQESAICDSTSEDNAEKGVDASKFDDGMVRKVSELSFSSLR